MAGVGLGVRIGVGLGVDSEFLLRYRIHRIHLRVVIVS